LNEDGADPRPRVIVVGLGNPVLGDDGVGWRVADEVERRLIDGAAPGELDPKRSGVQIERLGVGGIRLMETISGFGAAILIDAAEFPGQAPGEVRTWGFDELPDHGAGHLDSVHDASLVTALALGRRLGAEIPDRIHVVTIQAGSTDVFGEELSREVAAAVPAATEAVLDLLPEGR
jgi:hydrogenase maturation protease